MREQPRRPPEALAGVGDQPDAAGRHIGGEHGAARADAFGGEQCLPTRRGAHVVDTLARARIERLDDERRRLVLDGPASLREPGKRTRVAGIFEDQAPVVHGGRRHGDARRSQRVPDRRDLIGSAHDTDRQRCARRQGGGSVLSLRAGQPIELFDRPRPHPRSCGDRIRPGAFRWRFGGGRQPPEHGIDEATRAPGHEIHRRRDGGVRRHPGSELIRTESECIQRLGRRHLVERPIRNALDLGVEDQPPSEGAERELGREGAITGVQSGAAEQRGQQPVRVGAVVDHASDHLKRHRPRGRRAHPRRSPAVKRTPRAHAAASIGLRPAGATSTNRTPPPPAHTRTPRSSAATTVPGGPSLPC